MELIKRTRYLNRLAELNNTPDIKVITGVRRSGKSVLMEEYISCIRETEPDANIVFINLQDLDFEELLEYHCLNKYITEHYIGGVHNLLLIDEVQLCTGFEKVINSIHSKHIYDIYITGSNAFLLSSDLSTLFTGRTMELAVFPFSFSEYMEYYGFGADTDINARFDEYARTGGMPGSYSYKNDRQKYAYVKDVYNTIIQRDLVKKYNIRNKSELLSIAEFMMDNISNLLSPNNICDSLNKGSSKITRKTVSKYIDCLEKSFIIYEAKRYDLRGKKYLENNKKYYLSDVSFRYAVNGTRSMDFGRAYENIVFIELLRRGYEVYVGKLYKKEIDFVVQRQSEKMYIQVSDDISNPDTFKREYLPLLAINDAYPKLIIARTRHETYEYEGIRIVDMASWLLEG